MKPYYQDETITIYNGDCREIMRGLSDVDTIITSPPYNCRIPYCDYSDEISWQDYYSFMQAVLESCYYCLCLGGTVAINVPLVVRWQADHRFASMWQCFDSEYSTHRGAEKVIGKGRIEPLGFKLFDMMYRIDYHLREPVVWVKGSDGNAVCTTYAMGCDSDPYFRPAHEHILIGSKGQWFHRGGTGRRGAAAVPFADYTKDVWFITPRSTDEHPAVFPEEIPIRIIRLFNHARGSIVLDPFCGTGTTLMAAKKLGFKSIGIDISKRYCQRAAEQAAQCCLDFGAHENKESLNTSANYSNAGSHE